MNSYTLAGFGSRFLAVIIDGIIACIACAFLSIPISTLGLISIPPLSDLSYYNEAATGLLIATYTNTMVSISFFYGVAFLLYETLMLSSVKQATLGKMILRLKVVTGEGRRLTTAQALGRSLIKITTGYACFLPWAWALFNSKQQALHDLAVDDLVIRQ